MQVEEALRRNFPDFDVVQFLGEGPLEEQLKVFATATMIIAPHGAGLSNMSVCPPHTAVLEIGPVTCPSCYLNLSVKVRQKESRFLGIAVASSLRQG